MAQILSIDTGAAPDAPRTDTARSPAISHARSHPLRALTDRFHALRDSPLKEAPLGLVVRFTQKPTAPQAPRPKLPSSKPMSDARSAVLERRLCATAHVLAASMVLPTRPSPSHDSAPDLRALAGDDAASAAVQALFGGTAAAQALAAQLLQAFADLHPDDGGARRAGALHAAAALRRALPDAAWALAAWTQITGADGHHEGDAPGSADVADAWRAFAVVPAAWAVLQSVRRARGAAAGERDAALQVFWQASAELRAQGLQPADDAPAAWRGCAAGWLAGAPGRLGGSEAPHVLACRTLAAAARLCDDPAAALTGPEAAAWAAWRCGYRASGRGSAFNAVVARLHKFTTWSRRAEQRPELLSRHFLSAIGLGLSSACASRKLSPLSGMKWGLQGAALGTLAQEQTAHDRARAAAVAPLRAALHAAPDDDDDAQADLARLDGLDLDALAALAARHLEGDARAACLADLAQARLHASAHVSRPSGPLTIDTQRQVAREALEARHTIFAHHGQQGMALGAGLLLDTALGSVGVWGGPQLSATRTRRALVRIGSYSMGSELFMGVDKSRQGSAALVAQAGASIGPMLQGALSAGASAAAGASPHETLDLEGAVLRVAKTAPRAKDQLAAVQDALFDLAVRRRDGEAIDAGALWEALAPSLLAQPDVTVARLHGRETSWRVGASVGAGLRAGGGAGGLGPVFGAGIDHRRHRSTRSDSAGPLQVAVAQRGRRTTGALSSGLGATGVVAFGGGGPLHALRSAAALGGAGVTLHLGGTQCQVRMERPHGRVQRELVQAQHDFARASDLIAWLRSERATWSPAFGGDAGFEALLRRVAGVPAGPAGGPRTWMARLHLREEPARQLEFLLGQADALAGVAGVDTRALDDALHALLAQPGHWEPDQVGVAEPTTRLDDRGWALLVVARQRVQAGSEKRYVLIERPAPPAADGEAA